MNLTRWILDHVAQRRSGEPDVLLRISNLTQQTELARCVEVADHGAKRRKGLLGRETLSAGEGLWIVPCEAVHTFGMQFPIDLVYLDRAKRVKKVRNDMPPWRISVCISAHSVLELSSGSIRRTQTKPGDRLEFSSASQRSDCRSSPDALGPTLPKPGNKRGIAILTQHKNLRGIAEFLVGGICTMAFALTTVTIRGSLLALAYFRRHRGDRDWMAHGSLLMLVSVLVAPYTWLMDQAILIPASLHAANLSLAKPCSHPRPGELRHPGRDPSRHTATAFGILSVDLTGMARMVSLCRPRYGQSVERDIRSSVARGRA
jgi:uncharacterized membrane protein (UPF0127 family)